MSRSSTPPGSTALANWRDLCAYPAAHAATLLARWHWEFLRRNAVYQHDFERFRALSATVVGEAGERDRIARRHGLDGLMLDYRCAYPELFHSPRESAEVRLLRWETYWGEDEEGSRVECDTVSDDANTPRIRQHEVAVVFDMRAALDTQIGSARDRLELEQRRHRERRGRVDDYVLYLRVWDAEAAGVTPREMARVLFPDVRSELALRRVEAARRAAKRLVEGDYRFL